MCGVGSCIKLSNFFPLTLLTVHLSLIQLQDNFNFFFRKYYLFHFLFFCVCILLLILWKKEIATKKSFKIAFKISLKYSPLYFRLPQLVNIIGNSILSSYHFIGAGIIFANVEKQSLSCQHLMTVPGILGMGKIPKESSFFVGKCSVNHWVYYFLLD